MIGRMKEHAQSLDRTTCRMAAAVSRRRAVVVRPCGCGRPGYLIGDLGV